ncbi:MAG: ribokinase, partial [Candidatus Bipolaricaulota bacterium]
MSIAVIGSINMDLVAEVKRLPTPGETVKALRFESYPGGKGANQAVAAARLGSTVKMLGKVGDDELGAELLQVLKNEGVDTHWIVREAHCPTGRACVWVDEKGENSIVFWPGANARVSRAYVDHVLPILSAAQVILLQLEIPVETVADVLRALPRPGPTVILDPAPAPASAALSLPLARVDILTPNRGELELLSGERNQRAAARQLLGQGVGYVICKNGAQGCSVFSRGGTADYP